MFKNIYVLSIAVALMFVPTYIERADAIPLMPHWLAVAAPPSGAQPVYYRGGYRGGAYRGGAYRGGVPWLVPWRCVPWRCVPRRPIPRRWPLLRRLLVRDWTALVRRSLVALRRRQLLAGVSHRLRMGMWLKAPDLPARSISYYMA